jgi:hypothetical protein
MGTYGLGFDYGGKKTQNPRWLKAKSLLTCQPDSDTQIAVGNRDYHQLSQIEIGGAKRIYQQ